MPHDRLFLGLDIGTSGARAVVIDAAGGVQASAAAAMADHGADLRAPQVWWAAASAALRAALGEVEAARVAAVAVDGTSGTMLAVDGAGAPLGPGIMYNDPCEEPEMLARIAAHAPATSAAHGATSGLARALILQRFSPARVVHQADWIAFRLCGRLVTDANNALKTGYDPVAGRWPGWMAETGLAPGLLPEVVAPGTPVERIAGQAFGLAPGAVLVAGTTDGCASFLATGAADAGAGVSVLGTTLTIKILSDTPIFAPEYGIYSHLIGGKWLAGGASNTGGAALLQHFTAPEIAALSVEFDPDTDSGLDYYPLPRPGERFPFCDPALASRTAPRPASRALFLQGLFEGIAAIEALGYARLAELGAGRLLSVRTVGGGAANAAWARIRARKLGVPLLAPLSDQAAYGAALLAMRGAGA